MGANTLAFPSEEIEPELGLTPREGASEPTLEQIQAQLDTERTLRQQAESDRERDQNRLDEFLRAPRAQETQQEAPLGAMPDPTTDPDGNQAWHLENNRRQAAETNARMEALERRTEERITRESQTQQLWTEFQASHPAHASRRELATAAYAAVAESGRMPRTNTEILNAVTVEMDRMAGVDIASVSPKPDRSGGLTPDSGNPPRRSAPADPEEGTSTFHESIANWQEAHGLI